MKLMLSATLIALFGFIGYGISSYYIKRKRFFSSLSNFIRKLKTDIGFSSLNLENIVVDYLKTAGITNDVRELLNNFNYCLKKETLTKENMFKFITILSNEEQDIIFFFFKRLGRIDVFNQLEELDKFSIRVEECLGQAKEDSKKYCNLYTKLGVIIGAFVALIIF